MRSLEKMGKSPPGIQLQGKILVETPAAVNGHIIP